MQKWISKGVTMLLCASSSLAAAVEVGVASFNLGWGGTAADFARHLAVCGSDDVKWCDTRPRWKPGTTETTPEAVELARACQLGFEKAAGGAAAAMQVVPCNAYRLASRAAHGGLDKLYAEKLDGLRQTVDRLITEHAVQVLAFQEVHSDEVIRILLGKHAAAFDTCTAPHNAFQTIGFAWRKSVSSTAGRCVAEAGLAVKENPDDANNQRSLRPGLALALTVNNTPVTFLNVHLKAACANLTTNGRYVGRELTDPEPACQILNRQVAPLEDWLERVAEASPRFVLLGDFNRRIDEEAARAVPLNQVRLDGTDPAGPNKRGPNGQVGSRTLWQELSDGKPALVQVPLGDSNPGCKGFTGLDHIVLSDFLARLQTGPLTSFKLPVVQLPKQVIESSDHCPRVTKLDLQAVDAERRPVSQ